MSNRVINGGLSIDAALWNFVNDEALPGTGVTKEDFWSGLETLFDERSSRALHRLFLFGWPCRVHLDAAADHHAPKPPVRSYGSAAERRRAGDFLGTEGETIAARTRTVRDATIYRCRQIRTTSIQFFEDRRRWQFAGHGEAAWRL